MTQAQLPDSAEAPRCGDSILDSRVEKIVASLTILFKNPFNRHFPRKSYLRSLPMSSIRSFKLSIIGGVPAAFIFTHSPMRPVNPVNSMLIAYLSVCDISDSLIFMLPTVCVGLPLLHTRTLKFSGYLS